MLYPVINTSLDSMREGTSLTPEDQVKLTDILMINAWKTILNTRVQREREEDRSADTVKGKRLGVWIKGKRLGVWINGKLRFQSRDADAIHDYAAEKRADFRNNVWVAPIGSFVEV